MAQILITELTQGTVEGTGYFDELMKAVTAHLELQHKLGRIKGADYSTVYLGAMQYAMQQAVAFALGRQQADKQAELLAAQELKTDAEKLLVDAQELKTDAETLLVGSQKALVDQQKLTEVERTALTTAQELKTDAETALLVQKELTEDEQTILVQKQQDLYVKQTDGFDRDAEQKSLKLWTDVWSIARSTDPDAASVAMPTTIPTNLGTLLDEIITNAGLSAP